MPAGAGPEPDVRTKFPQGWPAFDRLQEIFFGRCCRRRPGHYSQPCRRLPPNRGLLLCLGRRSRRTASAPVMAELADLSRWPRTPPDFRSWRRCYCAGLTTPTTSVRNSSASPDSTMAAQLAKLGLPGPASDAGFADVHQHWARGPRGTCRMQSTLTSSYVAKYSQAPIGRPRRGGPGPPARGRRG